RSLAPFGRRKQSEEAVTAKHRTGSRPFVRQQPVQAGSPTWSRVGLNASTSDTPPKREGGTSSTYANMYSGKYVVAADSDKAEFQCKVSGMAVSFTELSTPQPS
ncbi:hypothetical protein LTR33_010099, partial [Friedmanniomyces endolithicus]